MPASLNLPVSPDVNFASIFGAKAKQLLGRQFLMFFMATAIGKMC
jgi:hypothetical protein